MLISMGGQCSMDAERWYLPDTGMFAGRVMPGFFGMASAICWFTIFMMPTMTAAPRFRCGRYCGRRTTGRYPESRSRLPRLKVRRRQRSRGVVGFHRFHGAIRRALVGGWFDQAGYRALEDGGRYSSLLDVHVVTRTAHGAHLYPERGSSLFYWSEC
jgi:hypothetical protein